MTPTLLPMLPPHLPAVLALAAQVPTAPHWPPSEYTRMLQVIDVMPHRRAAWVLTTPATLLGFALATHTTPLAELEAVVIHPAHRNQGHGATLVQAAIAWGRSLHATTLALELRPSNAPALALYTRLGFHTDGTRPRYYSNPPEDALLMSLPL